MAVGIWVRQWGDVVMSFNNRDWKYALPWHWLWLWALAQGCRGTSAWRVPKMDPSNMIGLSLYFSPLRSSFKLALHPPPRTSEGEILPHLVPQCLVYSFGQQDCCIKTSFARPRCFCYWNSSAIRSHGILVNDASLFYFMPFTWRLEQSGKTCPPTAPHASLQTLTFL